MISAQRLAKHYGSVEALGGVDFNVTTGEIVGLLGPNGAGKTTTMRLLTTYLAPSAGTALVAGFDICREPERVREAIGYLPETPPLYPELRVGEYLAFVARIKQIPRTRVRQAIETAIERCGLASVSNRLCGQLSRGFRQRVGIAQALIHEPPVIILDEPTSGLDPAQIIEMRKLILSLKGKHTVVLSTHILSEVTSVCSKVIIIAGGKVAMETQLTESIDEKNLEQHFLQAVNEGQP